MKFFNIFILGVNMGLLSCFIGTINRIVHIDTDKLDVKRFNSTKLDKYRVNDVLTYPIFQNNPNTNGSYSLNISSLTKNSAIKSININSYQLLVDGKIKLENNSPMKNSKFEIHWDKKSWGNSFYTAGLLLFDWTPLTLSNSEKIKLLVNIEIKTADSVTKKEITYNLKLKSEKYLVNLSQ